MTEICMNTSGLGPSGPNKRVNVEDESITNSHEFIRAVDKSNNITYNLRFVDVDGATTKINEKQSGPIGIWTRGLCLAKAAIYQSDLWARPNRIIVIDYKLYY